MKNTKKRPLKAVSLFSGAGGMDVGFAQAGFKVQWANDFDKDACATYAANLSGHIVCGEIENLIDTLDKFKGVDLVFGGPPCQGFSVAGKMDPHDPRSKLVWSFMEVVERLQPTAFVMENVRALAKLSKFQLVREELFRISSSLGYKTELLLLNSKDFGVPQSRERMFLIGLRDININAPLADYIRQFQKEAPTVREVILPLGRAGCETNSRTVNAKITIAQSPIMRKSPYAGMMFNGQGRPLDPDGHSCSLHASMGGNKTPIVDENHLYEDAESWVEQYHRHLMGGGKPYALNSTPKYLRRLTVDEAMLLQTFPKNYQFKGPQSSVFRQIGNAVPCRLAEAVGRLVSKAIREELELEPEITPSQMRQIALSV